MLLDAYQSGLEMEYLKQKEYRVDQKSSVIFIAADESRQDFRLSSHDVEQSQPKQF